MGVCKYKMLRLKSEVSLINDGRYTKWSKTKKAILTEWVSLTKRPKNLFSQWLSSNSIVPMGVYNLRVDSLSKVLL